MKTGGVRPSSPIPRYFRLEIQATLEDNELMAGEVNRHARWKAIKTVNRKFVPIINYVLDGFTSNKRRQQDVLFQSRMS